MVEVMARYAGATKQLLEAQNAQTADLLRLRVSDGQVEVCEILFRKAEQDVFDLAEEI